MTVAAVEVISQYHAQRVARPGSGPAISSTRVRTYRTPSVSTGQPARCHPNTAVLGPVAVLHEVHSDIGQTLEAFADGLVDDCGDAQATWTTENPRPSPDTPSVTTDGLRDSPAATWVCSSPRG